MKTLIFNGSPRKNGDTVFLLKNLCSQLDGEIEIIDTFYSSIAPCNDCRYCWENVGCCINDDMQSLYEKISQCDNIVIASPIYFSELTGSLLNVVSRFQTFYSSKKFLNINQNPKPKLGGLILCAGGDGAPNAAKNTADMIFRLLNTSLCKTICSLNTDNLPSNSDLLALSQIKELATIFNTQKL